MDILNTIKANFMTDVCWLVLVLICVAKGIDSIDSTSEMRSIILENAASFCKKTRVCGLDYTNDTTGSKPCCPDCSCSDDCESFGNCCFPQNGTNLPPEGESCFYPRTEKPDNMSAFTYMTYNMVDVCPNESRDGASDCGNSRVAPWGSMLPVYSKSQDRIFKNTICAKCHGVTDADLWKSTMDCGSQERSVPDHLNLLNSGQLPAHCYVVFTPPPSVKIRHLRRHECYITDPPKCYFEDFHIPSWSPMSRGQIIEACETGFWLPYFVFGSFQNPFCYVCNQRDSNSQYMDIQWCHKRRIQDPRSSIFIEFTIILDLDTIEHFVLPQNFIRPRACEMMNLDACKPIECPIGQLYSRLGKCAYPSNAWMHSPYSLSLRLTLQVPLSLPDFGRIVPEQLSRFDIHITPGLPRFWELKLMYYELDTTSPHNGSTVVSLIVLYTRQHPISNVKLVLKHIKESLNQAWYLNFSEEINSRLKVTFLKYQMNSMYYPYWTTLLSEKSNYTLKFNYIEKLFDHTAFLYFPINKLYFCSQVELEEGEYTEILKGSLLRYEKTTTYLLKNEYVSVINPDGSTSVRVCMDDILYYPERNISSSLQYGGVLFMCVFYIVKTVIHI